jgi:obg-like ATPase 1
VDPVRDLKIISEELICKDLKLVSDKVDALKKVVDRGIDKSKKPVYETLSRVQEWLKEGKDVREGDWSPTDIPVLNEQQLLTAKPIVYLVNIGREDAEQAKNKWFKAIREWCKTRSPGAPVIPFSAAFEAKWETMEDEEKKSWKEKKIESQIPKIITTGYHALHLVHYFTVGPDEVRAWTVRENTLAPGAAGVIHTDFEKFFISADQYAYKDFVEFGSEQGVQKAGKLASRGKSYVVQDGDILFFKHNAGGGGAAKKKK